MYLMQSSGKKKEGNTKDSREIDRIHKWIQNLRNYYGLTSFTSTIGHYFSWWNLETPLTHIKTNHCRTAVGRLALTMQLNAHVLTYKGWGGVDSHCCPSPIHPRAGKSGLCAFGVLLLAPWCELCFSEVSTYSELSVSVQVQGKRHLFGPGTLVPSREGGMLWQVWPAGPAGAVVHYNHGQGSLTQAYMLKEVIIHCGCIVTHLLWVFFWSTVVLSLVNTPPHYFILFSSHLSQNWCILHEARNVRVIKRNLSNLYYPCIATLSHNTWDLK